MEEIDNTSNAQLSFTDKFAFIITLKPSVENKNGSAELQ